MAGNKIGDTTRWRSGAGLLMWDGSDFYNAISIHSTITDMTFFNCPFCLTPMAVIRPGDCCPTCFAIAISPLEPLADRYAGIPITAAF